MRSSICAVGMGLLVLGGSFGIAQAQTNLIPNPGIQPVVHFNPVHRPIHRHAGKVAPHHRAFAAIPVPPSARAGRYRVVQYYPAPVPVPVPVPAPGVAACVNVMCGNHVFIGLAN